MKTKKSPAKPAKKPGRKPLVEIHVHPSSVEFFDAADGSGLNRVHNGAEGSENAAVAKAEIEKYRKAGPVKIRHFDASGVEVSP